MLTRYQVTRGLCLFSLVFACSCLLLWRWGGGGLVSFCLTTSITVSDYVHHRAVLGVAVLLLVLKVWLHSPPLLCCCSCHCCCNCHCLCMCAAWSQPYSLSTVALAFADQAACAVAVLSAQCRFWTRLSREMPQTTFKLDSIRSRRAPMGQP